MFRKKNNCFVCFPECFKNAFEKDPAENKKQKEKLEKERAEKEAKEREKSSETEICIPVRH